MDLEQYFTNVDRNTLERYCVSAFRRVIAHYALWIREAIHQMGEEEAFRIEEEVWKGVWDNHLKRLGKTLGFKVSDGVPEWLHSLETEQLKGLVGALAVNWLAQDGIWFQALEHSASMWEAKLANDTCWGRFSPVEAREIKDLLGLSREPGLDGLKEALAYRLYARLNTQSVEEEGTDSLILYVNDCRVQSARKRKGLEDYPCKSVGMIEYTYFAKTIDPRIRTECVACPPDSHPEGWFCAWRFRLTT
ncbi:MAG: cytosolic protein [Deltaproteobacteria bacterium]|nr:cytosolic protein [Deltaproteobacteria bacterium]